MVKTKKQIVLSLFLIAFCVSCNQYFLPEVKPVPSQKELVTVLHGQSTSDPGLEEMMIKTIKRDCPEVLIEWESMDWGEDFSGEMRARIAAGNLEDIIIGKAQDVYSYYGSGCLSSFSEEFTKNILPEALQSVTINGQVYGLPYNRLYQGVIYNKNIFYRYGLEVPHTQEDLEAICQRLNNVGLTPFAAHFREDWYTANILMQFMTNEFLAQDENWGDLFRSGKNNFKDSKEIKNCFDQVEFVYKNSWDDVSNVNQQDCTMAFAADEAAMFLTGTWTVQTLQTIRPDIEIGIFPYPNSKGNSKILYEPNITFMRNVYSSEAETADKVIAALIDDIDLAEDIAAFTQTESLRIGAHPESLKMLQKNLSDYKDPADSIDVSIGNNQLVWHFQDLLAEKSREYLEDKISLEDLLAFADQNRSLSS